MIPRIHQVVRAYRWAGVMIQDKCRILGDTGLIHGESCDTKDTPGSEGIWMGGRWNDVAVRCS